jgi:hypothetical protein
MKNHCVTLIIASALTISVVIITQKAQAQNTSPLPTDKTGATITDAVEAKTNNPPAPGSGTASQESSPIYGVTIPAGYRDWKLIAVNQLKTDKVDQLRAQLGNEIAIKAFKERKIPFPDGTIIAALHWNRVPSEDNNKVLVNAFPGAQSFVVESAVNIQFMVKDSKKYAATGGWGFGDFKDGRPGDEALHKACFGCHVPAHDYVFAHYAPQP